jgi:hypothetical protein
VKRESVFPVREWISQLRFDPISSLIASKNEAIAYFARRDLIAAEVSGPEFLKNLPEVDKIKNKQTSDGSWKSSSKHSVYPPYHHALVETFKAFRLLVTRYEFNKNDEGVRRTAEFLFSCQTGDGDFRGFIGNQYATYYTGAILSLLIDAGYETDLRVSGGMFWLLSMRQADGGWTIPILTRKFDKRTFLRLTSQPAEPVEPDRSKPFSHNWTNMVLQAFAAHSIYRGSDEAMTAAGLLKTRFFKPDVYSSYKFASYWTRFRFWWPNILTALRSLIRMGFTINDPDVKQAAGKLIELQCPDGLWKLEQDKEPKLSELEDRQWLTLEICRVLKRLTCK